MKRDNLQRTQNNPREPNSDNSTNKLYTYSTRTLIFIPYQSRINIKKMTKDSIKDLTHLKFNEVYLLLNTQLDNLLSYNPHVTEA